MRAVLSIQEQGRKNVDGAFPALSATGRPAHGTPCGRAFFVALTFDIRGLNNYTVAGCQPFESFHESSHRRCLAGVPYRRMIISPASRTLALSAGKWLIYFNGTTWDGHAARICAERHTSPPPPQPHPLLLFSAP